MSRIAAAALLVPVLAITFSMVADGTPASAAVAEAQGPTVTVYKDPG